jgi:hypothetical protein
MTGGTGGRDDGMGGVGKWRWTCTEDDEEGVTTTTGCTGIEDATGVTDGTNGLKKSCSEPAEGGAGLEEDGRTVGRGRWEPGGV